jgi:4-amino-4-deoxy-L-arabinose transferase-like glycosyltransferase
MKPEPTFRHTLRRHWPELLLLAFVLLIALAFRLWQLDSVPIGLHYDEAIDLDQALRIVAGARPLYISEGWGREALYYYLVAAVLQLVENNMLALRLTAVLCSLGVIIAAYGFARLALNRSTALLAGLLLGINFWSLFTGRYGVRNMTMPFILGFTVLTFWWAWQMPLPYRGRKVAIYGIAGALLGLTMYTYQPARFAPFIFLMFAVYVLLVHRPLFWQQWRGFVLFGLTAALVAIPLVIAIRQTDIEMAARNWLIEPMLKLLAGDPRPVIQNGIATLKMFSFAGDPLIAYNVPGRPVFVPIWTSIFFYIGLVLALWRWRQPAYAFLLIWMGVMLAPTVLTASAPNYNRAIAAQVPVMLLTAVGMTESVRWLARRTNPYVTAVPILLILLALWLLGRATWQDYFHVWPQQAEIPAQYGALPSVAARVLETEADDRPVLLNTRNIEDADPIIFGSILDRTDLVTRWVDTGMALVMPAGETETRLLLGAERWIDSTLSEFANLNPQPYLANEYVALYETKLANWEEVEGTAVYPLPASASGPTADILNQPPLTTPTFQESLKLRGVYLPETTIQPGEMVTFLSDWDILQDGQAISLAFFVHLLDENHNLVAQQDGLGFPPHSWHTADRMVHVHHLQTTADLPAGTYWIQFGLYRRETGERWLLDDGLSDRLVIGPVVVLPSPN